MGCLSHTLHQHIFPERNQRPSEEKKWSGSAVLFSSEENLIYVFAPSLAVDYHPCAQANFSGWIFVPWKVPLHLLHRNQVTLNQLNAVSSFPPHLLHHHISRELSSLDNTWFPRIQLSTFSLSRIHMVSAYETSCYITGPCLLVPTESPGTLSEMIQMYFKIPNSSLSLWQFSGQLMMIKEPASCCLTYQCVSFQLRWRWKVKGRSSGSISICLYLTVS